MSSNSTGRIEVPEAKEALDRFKMEVADELGVPLTNGYNGNLTSYQNGSVGGYMVKKMIEAQERQMSGKSGR
ncbi:small, acid-soluble spore protein, alpha/beta type [Hominifimenecus sp. rT4P-3]|uniref:small, acid-soluble spore protein, alpha/beta type n=1 Tax=Hominifimenecus sp. rT4P-3 TaxID=3242979 RepID=UPI003DA5EA5A